MSDRVSLTIKLEPEIAGLLSERAREDGMTPEQFAVALIADCVAPDSWPPLSISDEELRASIAEQLRQIGSGEAKLIPHEEVMARAYAIIEAAKARKT